LLRRYGEFLRAQESIEITDFAAGYYEIFGIAFNAAAGVVLSKQSWRLGSM
jgi:hypothetical protein